MKKLICLLLACVMLFTLVACAASTPAASDSTPAKADAPAADSSSSAEPTSPSEDEPAAEEGYDPITIQFWNSFTGADGDLLVELVDKFNAENKYNITVEMDISASFTEQLSAALAGGTGPAMVLFATPFRFQYGEYLQDMSDIFEKTDLKKDDFIGSYLDYCSEGDAMYLLPFQIVGYYLYWNKDLFTAAGLDPESPPTNWDEWQAYAEAITDESQNIYGSGISYSYNYQIAHIIQRFGGLAVTKDSNGKWAANFAGNEGYAKFLQMYKDMVDNGYNPLEADTDSMTAAGQIGMTVGGPWVTYGLDAGGVNYGISLIPNGLAGDMNSVEVLGFAVTTVASEEEKLAAYRFMEWWNTADETGSSPALTWSVSNGFPGYTYSLLDNAEYQSSAKLSAMSGANPDAPTDFLVDSSFAGLTPIISDVIPALINAVAFDGSSIEDALAAAQSAADAIVAEYN